MKKYILSLLLILVFIAFSCKNSDKNSIPNTESISPKSVNVSRMYVTDGFTQAHMDWTAINIGQINDEEILISMRSKDDVKEPTCTYDGIAKKIKNNLYANISNEVEVKFEFSGDTLDIYTDDFDNRFNLMFFCNGGATIAGQYIKTSASAKSTSNPLASLDEVRLRDLTRNMYRWYHSIDSKDNRDFKVLDTQGDTYKAMDIDYLNKRLKRFKASGFFTQNFIDNYRDITLAIDKKLKNGELVYEVGMLPPFGTDANLWCNCQDYPNKYWDILTVQDVSVSKNKAEYTWKWSDNYKIVLDKPYKIKAIKEDGKWKMDHLESLDKNVVIP